MNSISINEKKYVKATDIARELGYTADYVGQLCRAKKVDSQLVGRSWYVSEDSIRTHKKNRYRSTKTVSKKTIARTLDIETKDLDINEVYPVALSRPSGVSPSVYAQESFYTHVPKHTVPSYQGDDSDLIPTSTKLTAGKISVSLGDAQNVKIKSRSKEYDFNPTQRTPVRFSGSLLVKDIYEDDTEEIAVVQESNEDINTKSVVVKIPSSKMHKEIANTQSLSKKIQQKVHVRHLRKEKKSVKKGLVLEHNIDGIVGMRKQCIATRNTVGGTLTIPRDETYQWSYGIYFIYMSVILSIASSILIVGLQADILIQDTMVSTSYTFTFSEVMAAVTVAWK